VLPVRVPPGVSEQAWFPKVRPAKRHSNIRPPKRQYRRWRCPCSRIGGTDLHPSAVDQSPTAGAESSRPPDASDFCATDVGLAVSATLCRIPGIRQLVLDIPVVLFESFLAGRPHRADAGWRVEGGIRCGRRSLVAAAFPRCPEPEQGGHRQAKCPPVTTRDAQRARRGSSLISSTGMGGPESPAEPPWRVLFRAPWPLESPRLVPGHG